jgi:hypothetical protein
MRIIFTLLLALSSSACGAHAAKLNQAITFAPISDQTLSKTLVPLVASASSGLQIQFNNLTDHVCHADHSSVQLKTGGICSIQATQNGNGQYAAATPITQSFNVIPPPPPPLPPGWHKIGTVNGVTGNYTPVAVTPSGIQVCGNDDGNPNDQGQWFCRYGTWSGVGGARLVISSADVYDEGPAFYKIRASGLARGPSGQCYGMVNAGNGYPSSDFYHPSFVTSPDCMTWTYHGHALIEGALLNTWTDSNGMLVQEDKTALDHVNAFNNRYIMLVNYINSGAPHHAGLLG